MSGKAVGWAMEQRTGSPTTKLVLVKLADNAKEWEAWPSIKTISEDTELGESTVRMHLRKLEALGLITPEERFYEGLQLTTKYTLNAQGWVPRYEVTRGEKTKKIRGPAGGPPPQPVEGGGQDVADPGPAGGPTPATTWPQTLTEPLVEPSHTRACEADLRSRIWPAFQAWPGLSTNATEFLTLAALDRLADPPPLAELLACIEAEGLARAEGARARGGKGEFGSAPHNWLEKYRGWEKHLPAIRDAPQRIADGIARASRIMATLGAEVHAKLRRARLNEGEIAALDGVDFEAGPPPAFANLSRAQEAILRRHHPELDAIWPGVRFVGMGRRRA